MRNRIGVINGQALQRPEIDLRGMDRFGFVKGAPVAPRDEPRLNLTADPYFSDGMRLVVMLSPHPVPYAQVRSLLWEESDAPIAEGQTEAANRNVYPISAESFQD